MVKRLVALIVIALLVAGCWPTKPQIVTEYIEVKVAVPVLPEAPPELFYPISTPAPRFISPSSTEAVMGLSVDGSKTLKSLIFEMKAKEEAWREWYQIMSADK